MRCRWRRLRVCAALKMIPDDDSVQTILSGNIHRPDDWVTHSLTYFDCYPLTLWKMQNIKYKNQYERNNVNDNALKLLSTNWKDHAGLCFSSAELLTVLPYWATFDVSWNHRMLTWILDMLVYRHSATTRRRSGVENDPRRKWRRLELGSGAINDRIRWFREQSRVAHYGDKLVRSFAEEKQRFPRVFFSS